MPFRLLFVLCVLLVLPVSAAEPLRNQLAGNASPYLALHGNDPVHWQSWHPDVLKRAQAEGKLVFISVGYFSCHWCHVMQRESFQDARLAEIINRLAIPVKVDRELHPALDEQLIAFVRATRGYAGWPLNVFLTPQGKPLVGFVYQSPSGFLALLENLAAAWSEDAPRLMQLAAEGARQQTLKKSSKEVSSATLLATIERAIWQRADEMGGGFGEQNKFPQVTQLQWLLQQEAADPQLRRREFLQLTLQQMAAQGMRDHIGGGFFRYTTDPDWQTPHYEKMLYDNAQLMGLYAQAASVLKNPRWMKVAEDTFAFLYREMGADDGGFIASLSSLDAAGNEGGYYLWSDAQIRESFSDKEAMQVRSIYFGERLQPGGNAILPIPVVDDVEQDKGSKTIEPLVRKMRLVRKARGLPRDSKAIASWNALLLVNLYTLAHHSENPLHLRHADALCGYVQQEFLRGAQVIRVQAGSSEAIPAVLEDYAFLGQGLWLCSREGERKKEAMLALRLIEEAWERFFTDSGWQLSDQPLPMTRYYPAVEDASLPSSTAVLLRLSQAMKGEWKDRLRGLPVNKALSMAKDACLGFPFSCASHASLLQGSALP